MNHLQISRSFARFMLPAVLTLGAVFGASCLNKVPENVLLVRIKYRFTIPLTFRQLPGIS